MGGDGGGGGCRRGCGARAATGEAELQQKLQQLRADARRHQATILEKGNEIGALHHQLSERAEAAQAAVRMTLDVSTGGPPHSGVFPLLPLACGCSLVNG